MGTLFKKDIPEVPSWIAQVGDNTDSWFYQQLARFASQRAGASNNIAVGGTFVFTSSWDILTFPAKPVAFFSICPANIGTGSSYLRYFSDNWDFTLSYNTVGPVHQVSIITANTLSTIRDDNGDGTWSLDPNVWGIANSTTDPDFYCAFLQT